MILRRQGLMAGCGAPLDTPCGTAADSTATPAKALRLTFLNTRAVALLTGGIEPRSEGSWLRFLSDRRASSVALALAIS